MKVKRGTVRWSARLFLAATCGLLARAVSPAASPTPSSPSKQSSPGSPSLLSSSTEALFADGPEGSRNLVVVGRYLAFDKERLPLAVALLSRGAARFRKEGTADPLAEVTLGEAAEALARSRGTPPEGVVLLSRLDPSSGRVVRYYDGEAFRTALDSIPSDSEGPLRELKERAAAGILRARFPIPGTGLIPLWSETVAWLELAGEVTSPRVAESVSRRLDASAPPLGRLLLAAGRLEDLAALEQRLRRAGQRLEPLSPDPAPAKRLLSSAAALKRMRGNGKASFPQEVWLTSGPAPRVVRIQGEIGDLSLVLTWKGVEDRTFWLASPLLPVPGSLRVSHDKRTVTWLEVEKPTVLARRSVRIGGLDGRRLTGPGIPAGSSSP